MANLYWFWTKTLESGFSGTQVQKSFILIGMNDPNLSVKLPLKSRGKKKSFSVEGCHEERTWWRRNWWTHCQKAESWYLSGRFAWINPCLKRKHPRKKLPNSSKNLPLWSHLQCLVTPSRPFHQHSQFFTGKPWTDGTANKAPIIVVPSVDDWDSNYPWKEAQFQKLTKVAEDAPFGKDDKTVVDKKVRNCWQLNTDKFSIQNQEEWDKALAQVIDSVKSELAPASPGINIKVQPTHNLFLVHRRNQTNFSNLTKPYPLEPKPFFPVLLIFVVYTVQNDHLWQRKFLLTSCWHSKR